MSENGVFDAIVVGLGAVGSATVYQLAKRGTRVLGIDQFSPPHALGSSHGETRITREAIGEGAQYTPLVRRSHEIWREVEAQTGGDLFTRTGGLIISSSARRATTHVANFFENTLEAARRYGIRHEMLDTRAIRERFPQFNVGGDEVGYYEPGAGFLRPEACVAAQLALAEGHGAELHRDERVDSFSDVGASVAVSTARGTYRAEQLILCAGAWLPELLEPALARHFAVTRQLIYWYELQAPLERYTPPQFPIWIWELQDRENVIYGFPAIDGPAGGAKIATEQYAATTTPRAVDREVSAEEKREMYARLVAPYLPELGPRCVKAAACLYTATPDFHFVIDRHPRHERVIVASPCSGHGFKHSAAVGEALAQLARGERTQADLGSFIFGRFSQRLSGVSGR